MEKLNFTNREDWLAYCKGQVAAFLHTASLLGISHGQIRHVRAHPDGHTQSFDLNGRPLSYDGHFTRVRGPVSGSVVIYQKDKLWFIGGSWCDRRDRKRFDRHEGIYRAMAASRALDRKIDFRQDDKYAIEWLDRLPRSCQNTAHRMLMYIQRHCDLPVLGTLQDGDLIDAAMERRRLATSETRRSQ